MYKRIFGIISITIILGMLLVSNALAGPPWPAEVIRVKEGEMCYYPWLNSASEIITLTGEQGTWVVNNYGGRAQWTCHTFIDFNDPNLLSLDEVCALAPDACNGNGTFIWVDIPCYGDSDLLAYNSSMLVTPNGNVNIGCRFDLNAP